MRKREQKFQTHTHTQKEREKEKIEKIKQTKINKEKWKDLEAGASNARRKRRLE